MSTISLEKFLFFTSGSGRDQHHPQLAVAPPREGVLRGSHPTPCAAGKPGIVGFPPLREAGAFQSFFTRALPAFFHGFFRPWRNQASQKAIRPTRNGRFARASERDAAGQSSHPCAAGKPGIVGFPPLPAKLRLPRELPRSFVRQTTSSPLFAMVFCPICHGFFSALGGTREAERQQKTAPGKTRGCVFPVVLSRPRPPSGALWRTGWRPR